MDDNKQNISINETKKQIDQAAESWVRLCLYHIRQKKELAYQNKKAYEYDTK